MTPRRHGVKGAETAKMGLRGPAPKLVQMPRGNPGHRKPKGPPDADRPKTIRPPAPPRDLDKLAKACWRELAGPLTERGLLHESDHPALKDLAYNTARLKELQKEVLEAGYTVTTEKTGVEHKHPLVVLMLDIQAVVDRERLRFYGYPTAKANLGSGGGKVPPDEDFSEL